MLLPWAYTMLVLCDYERVWYQPNDWIKRLDSHLQWVVWGFAAPVCNCTCIHMNVLLSLRGPLTWFLMRLINAVESFGLFLLFKLKLQFLFKKIDIKMLHKDTHTSFFLQISRSLCTKHIYSSLSQIPRTDFLLDQPLIWIYWATHS